MKHFVTTKTESFVEKNISAVNKAQSRLTITDEKISDIEGFGGCFNELGYKAFSALSEEKRSEVMQALFGEKGCRFEFCRLPVAANDFALDWYSYDETPNDFELRDFSIDRDKTTIIPYVREAMKVRKDLFFFASPWSPPTWMKNNSEYFAHNDGTLKKDPDTRRAFSKYLSKYLSAYEKEGIKIGAICPQNEPRAETEYPSCVYDGEDFKDLYDNYLYREIRKNNPSVKIWLGTVNSENAEDFPFRFFESGCGADKPDAIGFQWIGKEAIQKTHEAFPNVPLIQTESECGDGQNTFEYAEYIFSLMQHYLRNGVCAYVYWNLILGSDPSSSWKWKQNSLVTVLEKENGYRFNPEYYLLKHFAAFVGKGDRSVKTVGEWSLNTAAFKTGGGKTVAVVHNPLNEERTVQIASGKKEVCVVLPARSFNTVVI